MAEPLESAEDEALIAHIQQGSHRAFAVLVERHSTRFFRLAYRFTANSSEAEDIVQEAFLKLWEQPDLWRAEKNARFTTWFYRVIVNRCLNWKKRQRSAPLPDEASLPDHAPDQEATLAQSQQQRLLEQAIAALPDRQRTALNLCFYEGLSNAEAAEIMGLHIKALQSLLMRAKAALKQHLQPQGKEAGYGT